MARTISRSPPVPVPAASVATRQGLQRLATPQALSSARQRHGSARQRVREMEIESQKVDDMVGALRDRFAAHGLPTPRPHAPPSVGTLARTDTRLGICTRAR